MTEPLIAILVVTAFLILTAVLFMPVKGIIPKWKKYTANTKRVLIEDGLKQLYESEYKKVECNLEKFAKSLAISRDEALNLIDQLKILKLIIWSEGIPHLTSKGQAYALKVIRIHRLWERYLADETSVKETDWHPQAELQEHKLTIEEADRLAAQLGNPLFDPHGDPIPTASGDIPKHKGEPLTQFKQGQTGRITHIEDEPPAVYAQIVAEGLHVGKQVRVIEISNERIKFIADADECILAPILAENITVELIEDEKDVQGEFILLSSLKQGEKAIVAGLSKACRGQQRRRLMDFGIVPGAEIIADLSSLGGDPVAYRIRGTTIALRNQQADQIYIQNVEKETKAA